MHTSGASEASLLDQDLTRLPGVGSAQAERLQRLGLSRVSDLLWHLPLRFEDRSRVRTIAELIPEEPSLVDGRVVRQGLLGARARVHAIDIQDEAGDVLSLRFFRLSPRMAQALRVGTRLRVWGVPQGMPGALEILHPELFFGRAANEPPATGLTPVYPLTEGVSQNRMRRWVAAAVAACDTLEELLPEHSPSMADALRRVHTPDARHDIRAGDASIADSGSAAEGTPGDTVGVARSRIAFEELVAHQIALALQSGTTRDDVDGSAIAFRAPHALWQRFLDRLPFKLTGAQARAIAEVHRDQQRAVPMHRLLQGDVGSGKTVVAVACALHAVENGGQCAFMAPTELLARQHASNLAEWLAPLGVDCVWVGGRERRSERESLLQTLASDRPLVAVGTHALFQEQVEFGRLASVIIDEQHRFGVHQRMALAARGRSASAPHQLIMTATPIPRTLAMARYTDLDVSVLDERPAGRKPVITAVISGERRDEVMRRIRLQCEAGAQVYWVCPLIEDSEQLAAESAESAFERLCSALPDQRIALLHGRMKSRERDVAMQAFRAGTIDVLVATTVIEVGVDVPNATLMIIESAERMGLAQLHQLRGRVGRGERQSFCVLLYGDPVSALARARLAALREHDDGFRLAEIDLDLRGPGEILGTRQTGEQTFRVARWERDQAQFEAATTTALAILRDDPTRAGKLVHRWLGDRGAYARVG